MGWLSGSLATIPNQGDSIGTNAIRDVSSWTLGVHLHGEILPIQLPEGEETLRQPRAERDCAYGFITRIVRLAMLVAATQFPRTWMSWQETRTPIE
jgi:hypothetical protein